MEIRHFRAAAFAATLGILTQIACEFLLYWHSSYDIPATGTPIWWIVLAGPITVIPQMLPAFVGALVVPKHKWLCGALIAAVGHTAFYQIFWPYLGWPFSFPPPFPFNGRLAGALLAYGIYGAFAGAAATAVSLWLSPNNSFKPKPLRGSA